MSNYVLEWSRRSNGFHVQPIEKTLASNQTCFVEDRTHDYLVLMVGSLDACSAMADSWRSRLVERSKTAEPKVGI